MGSVPIVHVGPFGQVGFALFRGLVGAGIGPFAQGGLDESLGLAVGFRRVGFRSDVFEAEGFAGCGEGFRLIARPVVRCLTGDCKAICREGGITRVTVMPRLS